MSLLESKNYPIDYSTDISSILTAMSFTDGKDIKVYGSMSYRSQLYAGDFDGYEIINENSGTLENYILQLIKKFKNIIKRLENLPSTYIGDIKCGNIDAFNILEGITINKNKVVNYNQENAIIKLENVLTFKLISNKEFKEILQKLKPKLSVDELLELKEICKFNVIRWTPEEVLQGYKKLSNGLEYTLEDGFTSNGMTKLDVVSWIQNNRFTDFSILYEFRYKNKVVNNFIGDNLYSLKENILIQEHGKNYFKMSKRIFSLIANNYPDEVKTLRNLSSLLTSDLGRIYNVYSDIKTLQYLLENYGRLPKNKIEFEIDQFRTRLSNVYNKGYLKNSPEILKIIISLVKSNSIKRKTFLPKLLKIKEYLEIILNSETKKYLIQNKLIPVPKKFLP